jgi:cob(I)alamin adenosyltransferase
MEYKKMLENEEYKKKLEQQKQEMIEEIKSKLFKLNRNLNIAVEKDKLLQQKINEMHDDIDYYKEQLNGVGIIYKDEEELIQV